MVKQDTVQVFENDKWLDKPACPVCSSTSHLYHCGRCNRPMVRHPDKITESCPICTTRIGRF